MSDAVTVLSHLLRLTRDKIIFNGDVCAICVVRDVSADVITSTLWAQTAGNPGHGHI